MKEYEVYETPSVGHTPLPTGALRKSTVPLALADVDDWLKKQFEEELHRQAIAIFEAAVDHRNTGQVSGPSIDANIFVSRISEAIGKLRGILYRDLINAARTDRKLRKQLNTIATEQGFNGFVEDIDYAIAGQIGYRFIGQILFYFALRRKIPKLKYLHIDEHDTLPAALETYWSEVRRYDYEALFKPDPIETLIPLAPDAQTLIRRLIDQLAAYNWSSFTDDVLGDIFERSRFLML